MSRKDRMLEGARVIGTGEFKLDRRRAMDKLAHFQLEDPHRYVVELVAAAIRAGATAIHVRNDADDFEIEWDGDHATEKELDNLFDHVFGEPTDDHPRMLQHLAQGVFGAIGLDPKYILVERPGRTLNFTDPLQIKSEANQRTQGMKVSVRERFSIDVVREFVDPFSHEHETVLLRQVARTCPIPLYVNGTEIQQPIALLLKRPEAGLYKEIETGCVWFTEKVDPAFPGVALIRDGIIVSYQLGQFQNLYLVGWIVMDDIRLNASRSQVVRDPTFTKYWKQARLAGIPLMVQYLNRKEAPLSLAKMCETARGIIAKQTPAAVILHNSPVFIDALNRTYSLNDLRRHKEVFHLQEADPLDPDLNIPQFAFSKDNAAQDDPTWQALTNSLGTKFKDGKQRIADRQHGHERRAQLKMMRHSMQIDGFLARAFSTHQVKGWIALGNPPKIETPKKQINIKLYVDGLPVDDIHNPFPNAVHARATGEGLRADDRFEMVLPGKALTRVQQAVREAARSLIQDAVDHHPLDPRVRTAALCRFQAAVNYDDRKTLTEALADTAPANIATAPLLTDMTGAHLSLQSLLEQTDAKSPVFHVVRGTFPRDVAKAGVLQLNRQLESILVHIEGLQLEYLDEELADNQEADRRRALPRKDPRIVLGVSTRMTFSIPQLHGEVGLLQKDGQSMRATVVVLHEGIQICVLEVPSVVAQATAVVEWPDAQPNAALDGLMDPAGSNRKLCELLRDPLRDLLHRAIQDKASEPMYWANNPLPPWLSETICRTTTHGLGDVPLFRSIGGDVRSLNQLVSVADVPAQPVRYWLDTTKKSTIQNWLSASKATQDIAFINALRDVPDFADVLLVDATRASILNRKEHGIHSEDASGEIHKSELAFWQFQNQHQTNRTQSWHAKQEGTTLSKEDELHVMARVKQNPGPTPQLDIQVLFRSFGLVRSSLPYPLPIEVQVSGSAITANFTFDGIGTSEQSAEINDLATRAAAQCIGKTVTDPDIEPKVVRNFVHAFVTHMHIPGITPTQMEQWRNALFERPVFRLLESAPISASDIRTAHEQGQLVLIHPSAANLSPIDDRTWLIHTKEVAALLEAFFADDLPPDETERLKAVIAGRKRRAEAERPDVQHQRGFGMLGAASAPHAPHLVGLHHEETAALHLSLQKPISGQEKKCEQTRIDWFADSLPVCTEYRSGIPNLCIEVNDPLLTANDTFDGIVDDAHKARVEATIQRGIDRFMGAMSQTVLANMNRPLFGRSSIVAWGATAELNETWNDRPVVLCTADTVLTILDLRRLAKTGSIRVVSPGTRGHTLDPDRPAIAAGGWLRKALAQYGPLVEFTDRLKAEDEIWVRQHAPAIKPELPQGPDILLSMPVPGPQRDGFLQVRLDGNSDIHTHLGWRPLDTWPSWGPVPLCGMIDDPALEPNEDFTAAKNNEAKANLGQAVQEASQGALEPVLKAIRRTAALTLTAQSGVAPSKRAQQLAALLQSMLIRAFTDRLSVIDATDALGDLADFPMFTNAGMKAFSARQMAKLNGLFLWTENPQLMANIDPELPLIRSPIPVTTELRELLGGQPASANCEIEAIELYTRMQSAALPFVLPPTYGHCAVRVETDAAGCPTVMGLSMTRLERAMPGLILIRSEEGIPIDEQEMDWVGMIAVVQVSQDQISADWEDAELMQSQKAAIYRCYTELIAQATKTVPRDALVQSVRALIRNTSPTAPRLETWLNAPLLEGPAGSASLSDVRASIAEHGVVLLDTRATAEDGPLVLFNSDNNTALLEITCEPGQRRRTHEWTQEQQDKTRQARLQKVEAQRQRAREKWESTVVDHLRTLKRGLTKSRVPRPECTLPDADLDNQVLQWLAAWQAVESDYAQDGQLDNALEVTVRLGERLS